MFSTPKFARCIALSALLALTLLGQTKKAQAQFEQPRPAIAEKNWRPGMVLKLLPGASEDSIKLQIAFDLLDKPGEIPKFEGVRFYSYEVPLDNAPHRIGWEDSRANAAKPAALVLHGTKYLYTIAEMDRTENGSVMIAPEPNANAPLKFRVRGVYSYWGQLFVLDEVATWNEPFYLYEEASAGENKIP